MEMELQLTKEEFLVLFEFLARFNQDDHFEFFEDQAEQKVLWEIEGQLEKILTEPFMPNYKDIIAEARNRVREKH